MSANLDLARIPTKIESLGVVMANRICQNKARSSALLESVTDEVSAIDTGLNTGEGESRTTLIDVQDWNHPRNVRSFGRLLLSAPFEDGDLAPRLMSPTRDNVFDA